MREWGNYLNEIGQTFVGYKVAQELAPPDAPVAISPQTGESYQEGQPASGAGAVFGIKPAYLLAAAGALVVLLVVMRMAK